MATSSFTDTINVNRKSAESLSKVLRTNDVKANTGVVRKVTTVEKSEVKQIFKK